MFIKINNINTIIYFYVNEMMKIHPQNIILEFKDNILYRHENKDDDIHEKICRICYDDNEDVSKLLSPCACSGSMEYIHKHCLIKWIETKNTSINNFKCELCKKKLTLKKLQKIEQLKLSGIYNNCYKYIIDLFFSILTIYVLSYIFYAIERNDEYLLVDTLDTNENKYLLKMIKKEINTQETYYFFFYFSFSIFTVSMIFYTYSMLLAYFFVCRFKLFFKLNIVNLFGCMFFSSIFFWLYPIYILFPSFASAEIFIYTSCFLSLINWPIIKVYCYNFNDNIKLMNKKYNKIEILNATFNPLQRIRQIQVDL
tara:strand:+ start:502 stop:1437 length:936 start_codon:yes stop_codon:yes gene_type:complete